MALASRLFRRLELVEYFGRTSFFYTRFLRAAWATVVLGDIPGMSLCPSVSGSRAKS
jgi:hypothetical protein